MKRGSQIFLTMLIGLSFAACRREATKTKEQVMQERLSERLERWKLDTGKKCLRDIETKAIALTDSIVIANAKLNRDTSIQAIIPGRPTRPDYKPPEDTVAVKPVLK